MADSKYNSVEITEEDVASLSLPEESSENSTGVKEEDTPKSEETQEKEQDNTKEQDEVAFELDGESYSAEDVQAWMKDSQNKEEWQKSNTQKAQDLSKWNKLTEKISQDEKFREYLGEYFYDNPDELDKIGLDGKTAPLEEGKQEEETPEVKTEDTKIKSVEERLNNIEMEKVVDGMEEEFDAIIEDNPDFFDSKEEEMKFLEYLTEHEITDMAAGLKLYTWDHMSDELVHLKKLDGNKQKNAKAVINDKETGGPEQNAPKDYKTYKEMSVNDPDIAKYFDN